MIVTDSPTCSMIKNTSNLDRLVNWKIQSKLGAICIVTICIVTFSCCHLFHKESFDVSKYRLRIDRFPFPFVTYPIFTSWLSLVPCVAVSNFRGFEVLRKRVLNVSKFFYPAGSFVSAGRDNWLTSCFFSIANCGTLIALKNTKAWIYSSAESFSSFSQHFNYGAIP